MTLEHTKQYLRECLPFHFKVAEAQHMDIDLLIEIAWCAGHTKGVEDMAANMSNALSLQQQILNPVSVP